MSQVIWLGASGIGGWSKELKGSPLVMEQTDRQTVERAGRPCWRGHVWGNNIQKGWHGSNVSNG